MLDQLRAARKLPEEQDFRQWKAALHEAYRATETKEHLWHLPDGRTLRVVTTPNPQGGVTYLFEDTTERLELMRRYGALNRVQGETLDNLAEGVAVFGSDGRMRLYNFAFERMWRLDTAALGESPHIETVIQECRRMHDDDALWQKLRATATAIDNREPLSERIERREGSVIDLRTVPLPDGATLVTFQDVTDTVNVERALIERNEALEAADLLKVDFVHHVSYELRSPLTNIIGFAHFLGEPSIGTLNEKQSEYLGYITEFDQRAARHHQRHSRSGHDRRRGDDAQPGRCRYPKDHERGGGGHQGSPGEGRDFAQHRGGFRRRQLRRRRAAHPPDPVQPARQCGRLLARGRNRALACERRDDAIVFSVTDNGPGIPPDMTDRVFDWFETHSHGSRHRGAGLGLSIVRSFVELHGGKVTLDSTVGRGTTVVCTFPLEQRIERTAA